MKHLIPINNWKRKEHFMFFSSFDDPFFGITTEIDFTRVYRASQESGTSFFLYSVHFLLRCINETEAFKLRIEDGQVYVYDKINLSPTIGRKDGTFGFGFFEFHSDLGTFIQHAEKEIKRVENCSGLAMTGNTERNDVIRYSALPWFAFSEMKHAGSFRTGDSIPRISTGKLMKQTDKLLLPISICAHHGLMDGRDIAQFLDQVKELQEVL